jgi:hypothetical protein
MDAPVAQTDRASAFWAGRSILIFPSVLLASQTFRQLGESAYLSMLTPSARTSRVVAQFRRTESAKLQGWELNAPILTDRVGAGAARPFVSSKADRNYFESRWPIQGLSDLNLANISKSELLRSLDFLARATELRIEI